MTVHGCAVRSLLSGCQVISRLRDRSRDIHDGWILSAEHSYIGFSHGFMILSWSNVYTVLYDDIYSSVCFFFHIKLLGNAHTWPNNVSDPIQYLRYPNWNVRLATGWTVRGSNPRGDEILHTRPNRLWGPPSLQNSGYRVFPGGKAGGSWRWPPTPSSAEVKGRVELYLYFLSGPS
jgi:hypothetical protein